MKRQIFVLALVLTTMACGTTKEQVATNDAPASAGAACFDAHRVTGYYALGHRNVHVKCQPNEHFLLTTTPNCRGLEQAADIVIPIGFTRICSETGAFLTYMDGNIEIRCRIQKVEAVADAEEARQLVE